MKKERIENVKKMEDILNKMNDMHEKVSQEIE